LKLKHLPVLYGIYLIIIITTLVIIKHTTPVMTVKALILCWSAFICMSLILVYFTQSAIMNYKYQKQELNVDKPIKKTPMEELAEYDALFVGLDLRLSYFGENIDRISHVITKTVKKLNILENLLENTFSTTDLTYTTYKSSLDSVISAFNSNLRSIVKRIRVFDLAAWQAGDRSDILKKYVSDIDHLTAQNEEILNKLEYLISELVSLDDPKNFSFSSLDNLIKQTQEYKNINDRG